MMIVLFSTLIEMMLSKKLHWMMQFLYYSPMNLDLKGTKIVLNIANSDVRATSINSASANLSNIYANQTPSYS